MSYLKYREPKDLPSATIGEALGAVLDIATSGGLPKSGRPDEPINDVTPERVRELRKMPYEEFLASPEWVNIKWVIRWNVHACELCGQARPLDIHHLTYERRGQEWGSDLLALCRPCHYMAHKTLESFS